MYALIENGEITRTNIEFPAVVNGIAFSKESTEQDARVNGLVPIVGNEPVYDIVRQRLTGPRYEFDGTKVNRVFTIEQIPDEEKASEIRQQRNQRLSECDWTQLADSTANKEVWATYRQALRDITLQPGFPWSVNWPEKP